MHSGKTQDMTLCWALNFFALFDFFGGFHLEMDKVLKTQEREAN